MRVASVRDLHIHTSELIREAEEGSVIVIERRGQPVAELRPVSVRRPSPEYVRVAIEEIRKMWENQPLLPDSGAIIEEDRNRP
jgi:prevent-host-death family protein